MASPVNLNVERAYREGDNRLLTPADMLQDALSDIESGAEAPTRAMLIFWTEDEDAREFATSYYAANLRGSEMLGLLEIIKARILAAMGMT